MQKQLTLFYFVQETYVSYLDLAKLRNVFLLGKGACTRALANHAIPATSCFLGLEIKNS